MHSLFVWWSGYDILVFSFHKCNIYYNFFQPVDRCRRLDHCLYCKHCDIHILLDPVQIDLCQTLQRPPFGIDWKCVLVNVLTVVASLYSLQTVKLIVQLAVKCHCSVHSGHLCFNLGNSNSLFGSIKVTPVKQRDVVKVFILDVDKVTYTVQRNSSSCFVQSRSYL